MRISTHSGDKAYMEGKFYAGTRVYVDGIEIRDCHTADEELGEAWVYARDEQGAFKLDDSKSYIIDKRLTGSVVIQHNI
jgi:hypothetical protein